MIQYIELPQSTSITILRHLCKWDQPEKSDSWRLIGFPFLHNPSYYLCQDLQENLAGKTAREKGQELFAKIGFDWP